MQRDGQQQGRNRRRRGNQTWPTVVDLIQQLGPDSQICAVGWGGDIVL